MDRRRLTIFAVVFTNILGSGVILPILPLFAEDKMGATVLQATLLNPAYWAALFVAAPWLGPWIAAPTALIGLLAFEHAYVQAGHRRRKLVGKLVDRQFEVLTHRLASTAR